MPLILAAAARSRGQNGTLDPRLPPAARSEAGQHSERGGKVSLAAPFIPPVWYRARPWDPPITNDAACF
ncbi:hypothetical protein ACTI_29320 [Actinoplanes sp. OR16]|nr:hypothetical protein ACTI_29320 [Actinoplanes sp. OR16]